MNTVESPGLKRFRTQVASRRDNYESKCETGEVRGHTGTEPVNSGARLYDQMLDEVDEDQLSVVLSSENESYA